MPEAINHRFKVIHQLLAWTCETERMTINPARDVKPLHSNSEVHPARTVEEVGAYLTVHPPGSIAAGAMPLLDLGETVNRLIHLKPGM